MISGTCTEDDPDFKKAYEVAENPIFRDRSQWIEYMI
jgi:hypothetical protein